MKTNLLFVILFGLNGMFLAQQGERTQVANAKALSDTIIFDLANADYYINAGSNFIDIPIVLKSTDPTINSFDFWFQFNIFR